jgi:GNAT superfamily N-acetyltransferase
MRGKNQIKLENLAQQLLPMNIYPVLSKADLKKFIFLPYSVYRKDPMWVPPLRMELKSQFEREKNPVLDHTVYQLFLLEDEGRVTGRIAAFYDTLANDFWKEDIGLFGYYECPDDPVASRLLLDTASGWLREKGMTSMRGPWSFVSQEWGMVLEGFKPPPVLMAPYNPPFYNNQLVSYGFTKVKDLLCYYISGKEGYRIPERILTLTDMVAKRYGVTVRRVNMKRYEEDVQNVIDISNQTMIQNWGYAPVTQSEADAMARDLKQVIRPEGVLFAEDSQGRSIGFIIALPDINVILKKLNGKMLPFGWLELLTGLPKLRSYRLFALAVAPEYIGKGIDSLMYRALYDTLFSPDIWLEINYVLEDNHPMNNAIVKLDAKPLRRYRIYEKRLK